jgi:hypothetical protein
MQSGGRVEITVRDSVHRRGASEECDSDANHKGDVAVRMIFGARGDRYALPRIRSRCVIEERIAERAAPLHTVPRDLSGSWVPTFAEASFAQTA